MQVLDPSTTLAHFPGQFWQWRDQSIYYVCAGIGQSDRPALLLVHGFGASTDHWRKNIEQLQHHYQVWAIDLLGFGRSSKPAWTYSPDVWREQLQDFIQTCIQKPVVLAGNSLGGYVCLSVGAAMPQGVHGVVLLNSAGRFHSASLSSPPPSPWKRTLQRSFSALLKQPWANFLLFQYLRQKRVIRNVLRKVYRDQSAVTDRLVDEIYQPSCDPGAAQVFASIFTTPQQESQTVDQLLATLTCPLLLLWGKADPWMNTDQRAEQFRAHYTAITEHNLQAGHCPHDEVPDQVNDLIQQWLETVVCAG